MEARERKILNFKDDLADVSAESEFYKIGFELTIDQAKNLQKIANASAKLNQFGIACSLNILSAEEALKALVLILKHFNPKSEIENFDKIFTNHKFKHNQIRDFIEFNEKVQNYHLKMVAEIEPVVNSLIDLAKVTSSDEAFIELSIVKDNLDWLKNNSIKKFNINGIVSWMTAANNDKNRGFYVDISNKKWLSPSHISKEKYEVELVFATDIISYAYYVKELCEREFILTSSLKS